MWFSFVSESVVALISLSPECETDNNQLRLHSELLDWNDYRTLAIAETGFVCELKAYWNFLYTAVPLNINISSEDITYMTSLLTWSRNILDVDFNKQLSILVL